MTNLITRRTLLQAVPNVIAACAIPAIVFAQPDEFDFNLTPEECAIVGKWLDEYPGGYQGSPQCPQFKGDMFYAPFLSLE